MRNNDRPHGDIAIDMIGRRPHERLYEEVFDDAASAQFTDHGRIMRDASGHRPLKISAVVATLDEAKATPG